MFIFHTGTTIPYHLMFILSLPEVFYSTYPVSLEVSLGWKCQYIDTNNVIFKWSKRCKILTEICGTMDRRLKLI